MNVTEALDYARELMDEHGLYFWKLQTDGAKHRLGQCNHNTKTLSFSRVLTEHNPPEMFHDTVLHEIAHALVGVVDDPHGEEWKAMARSIGIENPQAGADDVYLPDSSYRYEGDCGGDHSRHDEFRRHRLSRKRTFLCATCRRVVRWYDRKAGEPV